MPKIVDKEKMRKTILQSALSAFLKHGFYNTTMNLIAKETGIAKGTLYLYFDSKESLSIEFAKEHFSHLETRLMSQKSFLTLDALLAHIKITLLVSEEEAKFIPVFFEAFGPSFHSKEFRITISNFFDKVGLFYTQILSDLIKRDEISTDINPQALGRVLTSMLDGIVLHYGLFSISQSTYTEMLDEVLSLFKRGLTTSGIPLARNNAAKR